MRVKVRKLPRSIQDRLAAIQRGEGEVVAVKTGTISFSFLAVGLALVWFVVLYFLTDGYLWDRAELIVFSFLTIVAVYFLVLNLYKLLSGLFWRSYLIVTGHYVIEMTGSSVDFRSLEELLSVKGAHQYPKGKYRATKFTLGLADTAKTFEIKNIEAAEDVLEKINYLRKSFIEATARNDREYLDSVDVFRELRGHAAASGTGKNAIILQHIFVTAFSLALAAGVIYSATALNNYFDDKLSWETARAADRAAAIRNYRESHPKGRWLSDADQRLEFLYGAAEQKYKGSLGEGYDQKAADAVLSVLKYARESGNFQVKVAFERHNEIPPNIEEQLKKDFDAKKILPLGDALSDERMNDRESSLLSRVAGAYSQIIPNDILEFSNECSQQCVNFNIKYTVNAGDSIYFDDDEKKLPEADRTYNPGIFIDWDFSIQIPGHSQSYDFELESMPANHISYGPASTPDPPPDILMREDAGEAVGDDHKNLYDAMVVSAFDDFRANLIFQMGIGDDKKLNANLPGEEPTPSPDGAREMGSPKK